MSYYAHDTEIANYPAYKVVTRKADSRGHVHLRSGQTLVNGLSTYKVSSVISSAIKDNCDPVEALEHARKHGHDEHYIFGLGAMLTSSPRAQETHLQVDFEATYRFEGKLFKIVTQANNNLGFREVEPPENFY